MITPERIDNVPARRLIGLNGTFTRDTRGEIPALWERWAYTTVTNVSRPDLAFGVSHNFAPDYQFDYMCALEVSEGAVAPEGMTELIVPGGDYAVFAHSGHVSGISAIFDAAICGEARVDGYQFRQTPQLEVYGEGFDPATATGRVELWFPVEPA